MFRVSIPGPPVGKGRPRFAGRKAYTPAPTRMWESYASRVFRAQWGNRPALDEPLRLVVWAVKQRPKTLSRKCDPPTRMWRTRKPDADNVLKCVADSLQQAGVIRDDSCLVDVRCFSIFSAIGEPPCVEVSLVKKDGPPP